MKKIKMFSIIGAVIISLVFTIQTVKSLTQVKYQVDYEVVGGTNDQVQILNQHTFYGNKNQIVATETEDSIFCFFTENDLYIESDSKYIFRLIRDTKFTVYFKNTDNHYVVFLSGNDKIISFQEVSNGEDAVIPEFDINFPDYRFVGWNRDVTNVQEDIIVRPIYSKNKVPYTVSIDINNQITTVNSYLGQVLDLEAPIQNGESSIFSHWLVNGKKYSITNITQISVYADLEIQAIYSYANHYEEIIAYINDKFYFNNNQILLMGGYDVRGNHDIVEIGILLIPQDSSDFNLKNPEAIKFTAYKINTANEFAISIPAKYQGYLAKAYVIEKIVGSNNLNEFVQIYSDNYIKINVD